MAQSITRPMLAIVTRWMAGARAMQMGHQTMDAWRRDGMARIEPNCGWYQTTEGNRVSAYP